MQAFSKDNNGIKYLLTVIDIFSKFVWIVPLKRKTGQEVANAFSRILNVDQYNNKMYSSIKMTPKEASRKENEIKCGETYIQYLVVRPWNQNFRLVIMLE